MQHCIYEGVINYNKTQITVFLCGVVPIFNVIGAPPGQPHC